METLADAGILTAVDYWKGNAYSSSNVHAFDQEYGRLCAGGVRRWTWSTSMPLKQLSPQSAPPLQPCGAGLVGGVCLDREHDHRLPHRLCRPPSGQENGQVKQPGTASGTR